MATSVYRKPTSVTRNVGTRQIVGAGEVRIPLNKDHLTLEHQIALSVSQGFAVAPTGMANLAKMIKSIIIESDKGPLVNADGESIAALASFTENQPSERTTVGTTSTGTIFIDLHHENDEAVQDLLSALETGDFSGLDLVMTLVDPVSAGIYTGGGTPATPTFTVRVNAKTLPSMTGLGKTGTVESIDPETGERFESANEYAGIGTVFHRVASQVIKGVTTGDQQPIRLQSKNALLRFIQMMTFDATGANPVVSDHIIDELRLVVGGEQVYLSKFSEVQAINEARRSLSRLNSGLGVIDFGDDEVGFLNMPEGTEAFLHIRIATGAPAGWEIRIAEDFNTES